MKLLVLTLISGALLALSLPPFDFELLGWFALVPLLVAARGQRTLVAMGMGILTGVVCGAIHVEFLHCFSRTRSPEHLASLVERNLRLHEAGLLAGWLPHRARSEHETGPASVTANVR